MTKEEAKAKLRRAERDLRIANTVLEMNEQGVQEIQDEIAKLEAIINKPKRWQDSLVQPDKEIYFYLISSVDEGLDVGVTSKTDRKPEYAFRTREQAELIKEKTLLMQEMHAFAHVRNEGWIPDWENEGEEKFGIKLCRNKAYADYSIRVNQLVFGVAVKSIEIAEEMLEEFGERIKKVYNKQY